jgi:two-component system OmpR family sensor kinase
MTRRTLSIRWKLILSTFAAVLGITGGLVVFFSVRTYQHLAGELEHHLVTRCDEVLTVLSRDPSPRTLETLFDIKTSYRFSPYTYFYQILDHSGRTVAKSANLRDATLPLPTRPPVETGERVIIEDAAYPLAGAAAGERVRIRTEYSPAAGPDGADLLVQVAVSLRPFETAVRNYVVYAVAFAAFGLGAVFFLLWFVTTRSLRPVVRMTKRASRISASSLDERLPLRHTGDELDQLAAVLNDMLERLQRSLQQMEQFTSDAAHQLRTPLTRMRGELDLIIREGVPAHLEERLEQVQDELGNLSRVCGRLLLLARLDQEAQGDGPFSEQLDLRDVVDELLEQMAPFANEKAVELARGPVSHVDVRGSRPLLVEALLNLLDNAIRFAGAGGRVEVSLVPNGGNATVAVQDSGPGVPPDEHERIFRRFYRVAPARNDDGMGLGLSIVKAIARAHGGTVDVVSAPSAGACFRLTLPSATRDHVSGRLSSSETRRPAGDRP